MHQFFKFIFGIKFYVFRTVPVSIIRSFSTVRTHSNGICHTCLLTACEQDQDGTQFLLASCQQTCMTHLCCMYSEKLVMMDGGTVRNM